MPRAVTEAGLAQPHAVRQVRGVETLLCLYNRAGVLFLPSLTGGAGVALVEAMACEPPVVASRRRATAEISGDAADLVDDPQALDAWAEATRAARDKRSSCPATRAKNSPAIYSLLC